MSELPANSEENARDRLARLRPSDVPQRRVCEAIARSGQRCTAWALRGGQQCAAHAGVVSVDPAVGLEARRKAAETRREARQSVRARAAEALADDFEDVLSALRRGIKQPDDAKAAKAAHDYVALVYGRQLQRPEDEKPSVDPLEIGSMTRVERDELKRKLLAEHPELAERLRLAG